MTLRIGAASLAGMNFSYRREPIASYGDWDRLIAPKDNAEHRSAQTLARSWAGPLAVAGALAASQHVRGFVPSSAEAEAQSFFDDQTRGPRNHDLLLVGEAAGGPTIVSIEAKVDESFGQTVGEYRAAAQRKIDLGESTGALRRLEGLLAAVGCPDDARADALRYQLFSGVAGALAAARDSEASQAVFLVHEMVTPAADPEARRANARDLVAFLGAVFEAQPPEVSYGAWCVGPLMVPGNEWLHTGTRLYIAKAVTDLTASLARPWRGPSRSR